MLASPTPPPFVARIPSPVSSTDPRSLPSASCARIVIEPHSQHGSTPCFTAFSTRVISIIGGKGRPMRRSGTPTRESKAGPHAPAVDPREAPPHCRPPPPLLVHFPPRRP